MSNEEFEITLPYEGNPKQVAKSAKRYGLEIKSASQNGIDKVIGITTATFTGTRDNILELLDEFGGEENVLDTMCLPYGRIIKISNQ